MRLSEYLAVLKYDRQILVDMHMYYYTDIVFCWSYHIWWQNQCSFLCNFFSYWRMGKIFEAVLWALKLRKFCFLWMCTSAGEVTLSSIYSFSLPCCIMKSWVQICCCREILSSHDSFFVWKDFFVYTAPYFYNAIQLQFFSRPLSLGPTLLWMASCCRVLRCETGKFFNF